MLTKVLTKNKTTVQMNTKCEDDILNKSKLHKLSLKHFAAFQWILLFHDIADATASIFILEVNPKKIGAFFKEKYIFAKWNSYKCQFNLDSNSIQPFKLIH